MRKFAADKLFDGRRFLVAGSVLVCDDKGTVLDIVLEKEAGDDIQQCSGILSPGFINCHCHLELSHMKGRIEPGTGLVNFVTAVIQQRHFPEEQILGAVAEAEDEMIKNGIVAAGDICNNILTVDQKKKGRIYYHNFIEASGYHPDIAASRFERALTIFKEYEKINSIAISNSIVPHAPYSVSDKLWDLIINVPGNNILTIHNQEAAAENEWAESRRGDMQKLFKNLEIDTGFFNPSGKTSLQTYLTKFLPAQKVILVHNVVTSAADLEYSKSREIGCELYWCFCPNANQYITGQLPRIGMFANEDVQVVLGTDSLASNNQLSILAEMNAIKSFFPSISNENLLTWATSNGAKALNISETFGSFEKGKKPGVILLDNDFTIVKRLL